MIVLIFLIFPFLIFLILFTVKLQVSNQSLESVNTFSVDGSESIASVEKKKKKKSIASYLLYKNRFFIFIPKYYCRATVSSLSYNYHNHKKPKIVWKYKPYY